jgi:isoleucyl-tRNA synthetase
MQNNNIYPNVSNNLDLPQIEEKILNYWKINNIFKKSISNREGSNNFVFYDGPPFANGLPHYGHLLTGFVKDTVARYQTMQGNKVERRFGWDCHGLPAEMNAEKTLNISGRKQILKFGVDKFNKYCEESALKYTKIWEEYVNRQGRWVDFENDYKTMDTSYMESVIWAFKQLWDKGLVYESMRVMPYSWACETPLSNFETRLDNSYRERADKSITVKFTLVNPPVKLKEYNKPVKLLAWTTTPWTLPSNLALAISNDIEYCYFNNEEEILIIAKSSIKSYEKELGSDIAGSVQGSELVGCNYQPLFNYFADHKNAFKILHGDFVVEGDGTGIVHIAPGFGEDDQILCQKNGIELVCPVDDSGKFTDEVTDFKNIHVFDAIDNIIIMLKQENKWLKTEQYIHNYPHCWRTDTPLIYKAMPSWYIEVSKFKDRMVELNKEITWTPSHIKNGLFGKWIANAKDWSISRNRFWGTPIPIWRSNNPKYPRIDVYGSIAELERDFGTKVETLHKPFIDQLTRPNPDDPTGESMMVRIEDVFDCWFDSGSMPYGQAHYPFENKENFEKNFPADFIVEYTAQTRGWFYTLLVLSTALFDRPPFLNCICHGVILDEKGQKLSKRLQNYADPNDLFNLYGSDAMRYLMLSSPVLSGNELLIDKEGNMIREVLRLKLKPLWNSYKFFTLYANSDGIKAELNFTSDNILDQYILSKLKNTVEVIQYSMNNYEIANACIALETFIEILNNWYIRRSRSRFWKNEADQDKINAYNTLYSVLILLCKAAASFLPMLCEEIYLGLSLANNSVHLEDFPDVSDIVINDDIIKQMDITRDICSTALAIRNSYNIRIRQPLETLTIYSEETLDLMSFADMIQDEVNVKKVVFSKISTEIATKKLKVYFPVLGKRLPAKIKDIIIAQKNNDWTISTNGTVNIAGEDLLPSESDLTYEIKKDIPGLSLSSNDAVVTLDTHISDTLRAEGITRDVVRFIQQARKEFNLEVSDNINLTISGAVDIINDLKNNIDYINYHTLSMTIFGEMAENHTYSKEGDIEGKKITISFSIVSK